MKFFIQEANHGFHKGRRYVVEASDEEAANRYFDNSRMLEATVDVLPDAHPDQAVELKPVSGIEGVTAAARIYPR